MLSIQPCPAGLAPCAVFQLVSPALKMFGLFFFKIASSFLGIPFPFGTSYSVLSIASPEPQNPKSQSRGREDGRNSRKALFLHLAIGFVPFCTPDPKDVVCVSS